MGIADAILALAPAFAKLIENAVSDTYDKDVELQALLQAQRALHDIQMQKALKPQ